MEATRATALGADQAGAILFLLALTIAKPSRHPPCTRTVAARANSKRFLGVPLKDLNVAEANRRAR